MLARFTVKAVLKACPVAVCRRPRRLGGGKGGEGREAKEPKNPAKRIKKGLPPLPPGGAVFER